MFLTLFTLYIVACIYVFWNFRLAARVLLYAPSHRQDSTYRDLCYTSRGALAGMRNSSVGPPWRIDPTTWLDYSNWNSSEKWNVSNCVVFQTQLAGFVAPRVYVWPARRGQSHSAGDDGRRSAHGHVAQDTHKGQQLLVCAYFHWNKFSKKSFF